MVLPLFFITNAGRLIPIVVGMGSALARFVAKNPKIIGTTLSLEAYLLPFNHILQQKKKKLMS